MEANKENIDTFDKDRAQDIVQLEPRAKPTEDNESTTKALKNLEDVSVDKKRRRSSIQKRVSFGGSQVKIFERNEEEWNEMEQGFHESYHSEISKQNSKDTCFSDVNGDTSDTITMPSLSSLLKDTEGETTEWKIPEKYSTGNPSYMISAEANGYSEDTDDFDDIISSNNSLSFFMDEDVSKAAKLPRVSIGDTTFFPSNHHNDNRNQWNSSIQKTKDYDPGDNTNATTEITDNIPKLHDLLGEDETLTSNWESVRKSIEMYQNSAEDPEDADASFERMYGRVFGSPSSNKSPQQLYHAKEITAEITKSIPSLRMLMEEDTTVSLPRMPVNASDLKNVQRQIQMDETEDKRISTNENDDYQTNETLESYGARNDTRPAVEALNEEDWSVSTTDFKKLQSEKDRNEEDELVATMEESNRDYTWPVSRPQTDNEDWTLQEIPNAQETVQEEKTPKFRFVKRPPVYTPNRKVQTESKDNRITEHHELKRNEKTTQSTKMTDSYTPSPNVPSSSKMSRLDSTMRSYGQDRKQSFEFRRKSIAAHVKRLSTLPSTHSNPYDSTPSNNNWNASLWEGFQKQETIGDDDDSELHALTDIFMTNENEMAKNSASKQSSHNAVSEFLQEAKVRFLDNVSSRRRQTSYGVYTTDDRSTPDNEEGKIVGATGLYGWLKKLEALCEKLESSCTDTEARINATESSLNKNPPELLCKVLKKDFQKQQLTKLQISMKRLKNFCRLEARCRWYERRSHFENDLASELEHWISCFKNEIQEMESHLESLKQVSSVCDSIAESEKLRLQPNPLSTDEQRKIAPIIDSLNEQESVRQGFMYSIESLEKEIQLKEDEKRKIQQEGEFLSKRRQSLEQYVLSSSDAAKTNARSVQERFELYCRLLGISFEQISNTHIDIAILGRLNMKVEFDNDSHIFCQSSVVSNASDAFLLNNCITPFTAEPLDNLDPTGFRNMLWSAIYKVTLANLIEKQLKSIQSLYIVNITENGLGFAVESIFASSKLGWKLSVCCKCDNLWHSSPIYWEVDKIFGDCEEMLSLKDQLSTQVTDTSPFVDGMKTVRQWLIERASSHSNRNL